MLTRQQIQHFHEEGYVRVPGVIPKVMVDRAKRAINHSIGTQGKGEDDLENFRSGQLCDELKNDPVVTDIFNKTPVIAVAEQLLGEGNVQPIGGTQIALRFPASLGDDVGPPRGHLDGLGTGTNGMAKGVYRRGFSAFCVVYLQDVPEAYSGNFTVWPRSHRFFEDYFKKNGHEVLAEGMPKVDLPEEPVMVTGKAGDVILAHHALVHTGGPNGSPDIRYALISRLRHKDCDENGVDVYTDIWREWPGVRAVLETA